MRKMILLAAMVAIAALMLAAAPAMADDNDGDGRDDVTFRLLGDDFCDWHDCHDDDDKDFCDWYDCHDDDDKDFCDRFDCNNNDDDFCHFFDCRDDHNNNFVPVVTQDFEQEAESGDVDQSFDVSGTGDNSNQTAGIQGVANTGNAQNQIGVIDAGGFGGFGDFEFEDVGSTIEVSPTNTVTSDQEVNQAAAAFGHKGWW